MQDALARLRFLLAQIETKERELALRARQFRNQLSRAQTQALYGAVPLDVSLNVLDEMEERLASVERSRERLAALKRRAQNDLEALHLTLQVEQAKERLAVLRARAETQGFTDEETGAEIRRLNQFILETSQKAGDAIRERSQDRPA